MIFSPKAPSATKAMEPDTATARALLAAAHTPSRIGEAGFEAL